MLNDKVAIVTGASRGIGAAIATNLAEHGAKIVVNYNSSADARLAVQRGEIQYHDESIPGYRGVVEPQLVKTGIVTPLYYHDVFSPEGSLRSSPCQR